MSSLPYRDPAESVESFDEVTRSVLAPEIEVGEALLWAGRPVQGLRFAPVDLLLGPFSVLWGGFALFWEFGVIADGAPLFFQLWGVPFVLVGLYLIAGRFFYDRYRRANTIYGVTDQRVLIVSLGWRRSVTTLDLRSQHDIVFSETGRGRGTITFGKIAVSALYDPSWRGTKTSIAPRLADIERARDVYACIRQVQRKLRSAVERHEAL
ncbi:MAG TPA: hypothetical protein VGY54_27525 [Polyangiaceae bacterium]|jgi:hypothetical protein|nr:hypothetical protein [Polyangiaceae bacterium]